MLVRTSVASAFIVMSTFSFAQAEELSGEKISELITDKKVVLATTWGSFPLRYDSSQEVTGDGSGVGLSRFFAPKETGKWWVASDELCQQFPTWYKGRSFCFKISQTGPNKIKWVREDGFAGTAVISN